MQDSHVRMLTHVEFRSDRFPADPDEGEVVNPGIWGRLLLAVFLRERLRARGFQVGEPFPEDWGWALRLENQPFRMWIGGGHYQEYPDGYLCFIEPHEPFVWKLLRRVDTRTAVGAVQKLWMKFFLMGTAFGRSSGGRTRSSEGAAPVRGRVFAEFP